jgi:predicted transcriptional regulator
MKRQPLGEQESALLRFIADHGAISVGEAAEEYGGQHGLARTTILTVMERLRKKCYLTRQKDGGIYRYTSCVSKAEMLSYLVGDFAERMLEGSLQPFVAYLVENKDITAEEMAQLRALVEKYDDKRKEVEP